MSSDLNYVNYNFEDLVTQLTNRLKESATWKDTYRSGTGQMIIELFAYVGNLVLYNLERVAQEGYIGTALNRSSVINLVRLLGYNPKRAISAVGSVTFTLAAPKLAVVFFPGVSSPNTVRLETASGIKYVVLSDVSIPVGQTTVSATVVQGQKVEKPVTSNGSLNQEYKLDYTNIENTGVYVAVDGVPWTMVDSFVSGTPTSKWFKVRNELDGTVSVIFGDNVTAMAPTAASNIVIRYIRTDGVSGNIYTTGLLNVIASPVFDTNGVVITDLTASNASTILGGAPEETTDEIRYEAPQVFAAGDRLVTREDYVAILENYGSIATANAWGENEEEPPNYSMFNRVKLSMILQTAAGQPWTLPGNSFLDTLSIYLRTKAQITVKYTYIAPVILEVIPTLDVKVYPGYALLPVQNNIVAALEDQFVLGTTTKLGVAKRISDLSSIVEAIPGVVYHHLYLDLYEVVPATGGAYNHELSTVKTGLKKESVSIYDGGTEFAYDDGIGNIKAVAGGATIGAVNYSTGTVGVNITPTGVVSVRYQVDEAGDIVTSFNQICHCYSVDVTNISYNI